ncbi:MAG: anaerobic ribonucleoside-triphosphate reductase activating protein [bacterium]|nr:anaerobic ribonucleoside-triphosphate reductase activating protein [bacterium]
MKICGLMKTTLLDFPGHIAATIFTGSCQFRCPFCQNSALIPNSVLAEYTEEEILAFLKKRSGILEGVAITGGEPTLQPDLQSFIRKVRALGFLVKLDTNGYRPDVLKHLCEEKLLDYVAMDIKSCPDRYRIVSGVPNLNLEPIFESISFLKQNTVPFEFRTTLVKELHTAADMEEIGKWLAGDFQYFLQNYKDSDQVLTSGLHGFTKEELLTFASILKPYIPNVNLRGID